MEIKKRTNENNFFEQVYEVVKLIPCGKVTTYGEIAKFLSRPKCARQVGWALHNNQSPIVVPCHRVVFADGSLSPAFAFGGENKQRQLLACEGVTFNENKVNMDKHFYRFV